MDSQKETTTYLYLTDEEPVKYDFVRLFVDAKDIKMDKFKCVECGQNEVDDEDDVCEDCWAAEQDEDNEQEDEE